MSVTPRAAVLDLPRYRAGRRQRDVTDSRVPEALARLASNESPFGPLPTVIDAIEELLGSINRYPEVRSDSLRSDLAVLLGVGPSEVTIGPGSAGLLWQLAQVFLDEESELLSPWPSFEAYPIIAQLMGAGFRGVPLVDDVADVAALVDGVTERTKLVVLAEPNNPTGTSVGEDAIAELVARTADRCIVVLDEAYVEFAATTVWTRSIALTRRHPHVVVLRTFSKAHGLAGLRVGYAVGHPSVIDLVERVAPPFAVSSIAQVAAGASLRALGDLAARVTAVKAERQRLTARLAELGVDVPPSSTNFVWLPCGADAERWASELERSGIITRPLPGEGVRITIGEPDENDRVVAAVAAVAGRRAPTADVA